jgi:hypothetical protein
MAATKSTTKPESSLDNEPGTATAANAGNETDVKLEEGSTIKEQKDDEKADPGEIKTGVSADEIPPSGSISEKEAVADIPMDHPSVDDNPRKNQPAEANRIDFNDPKNF